ncbi:MAG TPA: pyridoxamine kinase [Lachnospiraceae bacterium]|nr:pyridoxamine kinase [Lachnospiraceae bacterium]
MSHNHQKKIAVINDMSGFGRCSLTVSLPIISYLGIQCCPVPTSILSNHMGYGEYFFDDYTDRMGEYIAQWRRLGLKFEGIATGFLGSKAQIETVIHFIREFRSGRTKVIVDPVMGDNGRIYATYTEEMCVEMERLIEYADIITPNLTECCRLTDTIYKEKEWAEEELCHMAKKLMNKGPEKVVITGIPQGEFIASYAAEKGKPPKMIQVHKAGAERSGTGDVFASIIAADAVNGVDFEKSVQKASDFVRAGILKSVELEIPSTDGVCFEEILYTLERD